MKHESGLPFAIDRSRGKDEQQSVVFYGQRPFLQAGELNEVQTIIRGAIIVWGALWHKKETVLNGRTPLSIKIQELSL